MAGDDAALAQRAVVRRRILLERVRHDVAAHRLTVDVLELRRADLLREDIAEREGVARAGARLIAVRRIARRRPGIAMIDEVLADRRRVDREKRRTAAEPVREVDDIAVPLRRHLDLVGAAGVVAEDRAGARQRVELRVGDRVLRRDRRYRQRLRRRDAGEDVGCRCGRARRLPASVAPPAPSLGCPLYRYRRSRRRSATRAAPERRRRLPRSNGDAAS